MSTAESQSNGTAQEQRLTSSFGDGAGNSAERRNDGEKNTRADNDVDEHVPAVVLHVRKNFGVLAPVIEPYIYRSGYMNRSTTDVYGFLSQNYMQIVEAALRQVGIDKFMMQMEVMLTQILFPEFGEDTEYLVSAIVGSNHEFNLFLSLLSRTVLTELVAYAQQMIHPNMYYGAQEGVAAGGAGGGRGMDSGAGGNYYRGGQQQQQQQNYRSGASHTMRDHRGGPNHHNTNSNPAVQQDNGSGVPRPYRRTGGDNLQVNDGSMRERSSEDLRANSDVLSQREESREWNSNQRGASTPNPGAPTDATVGGRGGTLSAASASRPSSEVPPSASAMPRHNHFVAPPTSAAAGQKSVERVGIAGMPQHHFLPQRTTTAAATNAAAPSTAAMNPSAMARLPTPSSANASQNSSPVPVPSMVWAGGTGMSMMHSHLHLGMQQQQQQQMMMNSNNNGSGMQSEWQNNMSGNAGSMSPITPVTPQRTVTPPSPQHMQQQQQQQQQQPARTMNIPAPLSVQRRAEEKNAAAAAAAAAAVVMKAAGPGSNNSSMNNASAVSGNPSLVASENIAAPRSAAGSQPPAPSTAQPAATAAAVPAPRGLQGPPVHHVHHMPVTHHHHHARVIPAPIVVVPAAPATHSPPPTEDRASGSAAAATSLSSASDRETPLVGRTSALAAVSPTPTRASAPSQPLRGMPRFPAHHHHHHHLLHSRVDAASAPVTPPPTAQPASQVQRVALSADVQQQQQQQQAAAASSAWPNEKEDLRNALLGARVSEKAVSSLMAMDLATIDELHTLKYQELEKRLRPHVAVLLDRQRIRQVFLNAVEAQRQAGVTAESSGAPQKSGAEETSAALSRRPPSITVGSPAQGPPSPHSSPTSKSGVQVPQPRTRMQQQQQQSQSQQPNGSGSPVASPTDASYASSELESSRREGSTKNGSPSGFANASSNSNFQPNNSTHTSSRPDEQEDGRDEEQRRGSGRRGGKRGGARGGAFSSNRVCKYYGTAEGCQYGDKCHYVHNK